MAWRGASLVARRCHQSPGGMREAASGQPVHPLPCAPCQMSPALVRSRCAASQKAEAGQEEVEDMQIHSDSNFSLKKKKIPLGTKTNPMGTLSSPCLMMTFPTLHLQSSFPRPADSCKGTIFDLTFWQQNMMISSLPVRKWQALGTQGQTRRRAYTGSS